MNDLQLLTTMQKIPTSVLSDRNNSLHNVQNQTKLICDPFLGDCD